MRLPEQLRREYLQAVKPLAFEARGLNRILKKSEDPFLKANILALRGFLFDRRDIPLNSLERTLLQAEATDLEKAQRINQDPEQKRVDIGRFQQLTREIIDLCHIGKGVALAIRRDNYLADNSAYLIKARPKARTARRSLAMTRSREGNLASQGRELFRVAVNELIRYGNEERANRSIQAESIPQLAALIDPGRVVQQDIVSRTLATGQPNSPSLPHHDLGSLYIYRRPTVVNRLHPDIVAESVLTWPKDPANERVAIAVEQLLPQSVILNHRDAPLGLKDPEEVARGVVKLTQLVLAYSQGELMPPGVVQLGRRNQDQRSHLAAFLKYQLAGCVTTEMLVPNRNEDQIRRTHQALSGEVRQLVEWIIVDRDRSGARFMVKQAIEDGLEHDVLIVMLTSRLSTKLFSELDFPAIDLVGPERFAELLRNSVFVPRADRPERIGSLVSILCQRSDAGAIDIERIFTELNNLKYGDEVIRRLVEDSDDDCWEGLYQLLSTTSYFSEARRELYDLIRLGRE